MDLPSDHIRRELRGSARDQQATTSALRALFGRLVGGERDVTPELWRELLPAGFDRRGFLRVGGASILAGAVLAACGGEERPPDDTQPGRNGTNTTFAPDMDVVILRTASSLERFAVAVYDTTLKSGLMKAAPVEAAATLFKAQHLEHAELIEDATNRIAEGMAFTTANPAVTNTLRLRIEGLKTERDVVQLAYDVESVTAATYLSTVGGYADTSLNATIMSVAGVEGRHVAVLGGILKSTASPQFPADGFQTNNGAIAVGTGV